MIVVGYDGSDDARAAITHAGSLLSGQEMTVLTVWEPFIELLTRTSYGGGMMIGMTETEGIDDANREGARKRAEEGAALARTAGLDATARSGTRVTSFADAIIDVADELDAAAILVGSRGLTGVKSLLLGSVSHALIQHADRPVIVVPSPKIAAARAHRRSAEDAELAVAPSPS
jgi:nucleotide-binding universal stress UspA family protein